MKNSFKIHNNTFTKTILVFVMLVFVSNVAFSFQSIYAEKYLRSEIVEKKFDESAWSNAIDGIDYSQQTPAEKKEDDLDEPDVEDEDDARSYDSEVISPPRDMGAFWRGFFKFFLIALAVIVLAFIIANMVGAEGWSLAPVNRKVKPKKNIVVTLENIEENIYESDLDKFIREALEGENYAQAVRLYYLAIIKELSLKKWIKWKKDKTNRDYIRELSNTNFQNNFRNVTRMFEHVWYGKQELESSDFKSSIQPQLQEMLQSTQGATKKI